MKNFAILTLFAFLLSCSDEKPVQTSSDTLPQLNKSQPSVEKTSLKKDKIIFSDLTEFKVLSVTEGLYENAPALQVNLTLPVDSNQDVDSLIKVFTGKEQNQRVKGGWIFDDNNSTLYFPFIEANTSYKVLIDYHLLSIKGKEIQNGFIKDIHTRAYQKTVKFISKGSTLLKDSNVLPIEAVNVKAIDLKFWKINPDKYAKFLQMSHRSEIYTLEHMYKLGEVVYTAEFDLEIEKNKREKHNVNIEHIKQVQKPGLYFVTMIPHDMYSYNIQSTWFVSTDIGIHTRRYPDSLVVFTHKLPEAEPYQGVSVKLMDHDGKVLQESTSDESGFLEINSTKLAKSRFVLAQKGNNFNIVRLNQPKMDLSEFNLPSRLYHSQELFLYAPRDLYRPGETININGLLRGADGKKVKASPIKIEIKRPDYRVFKSFDWVADETSLYTSEFSIPKDAITGQWIFVATLANKEKFEYFFSIEDFLPERLKLDLESQTGMNANEKAIINVQSDYLYGAPAAKNKFDATVSVRSQTYLFEEFKDYEFGSKNYRDYDLDFNVPMSELDENGFVELKIKNQWNQTKFPLRIKTFVNIYESGGRPISRSTTQTVWPHKLAIGVRPTWTINGAEYASPNRNNEIELIAVNKKGEKESIENVDVLLIRENNQRYWHWGDDGWSYNRAEENVAVFNTTMNLKSDKVNKVNLPLDYGNYRVEIRDAQQILISSYRFFSGWSWYDAENSNGEKPDQVKLAWKSDTLTQGDESELTITAPYTGLAIVTVESDKILWKKSIELKSPEQNILIPISKDWNRHDLYLSVLVIAKGQSKRKHLPARSFGVIHMPLNREKQKLSIEIKNPEKILPESQVTISVKASNLGNQASYVTLAAVDTGVLNVSNFKTPEPFKWLYAPRKYIAELRDMYGSIIAYGEGKSSRQKFGGDADVSRGGDEAQSEVQIISLFHDKVQFNDEGIAQFTLDIPFFNGEIRLMAMAYNDTQVAGVDSYMKVAAPIVVSNSSPRFIAKGDETFSVIDIHNTEDFTQEVQVELLADKYLGNEKIAETITLKAQEKKILKLPLKAMVHRGLGSINVKSKVKSKTGYSMDRSWKLGIRPAQPAITNTEVAVIGAGKTLEISDDNFSGLQNDGLKTRLKVSSSPVLNSQAYLQNLIQYPYGCLEQTSSRAWPLLELDKQDLSLFNNDKAVKIYENRVKHIDSAISRIIGMQRYDGGFGLWSNSSHEERWLTVYVTEFLLRAKELGYNVPEKALQKAIKRLQIYVRKNQSVSSDLAKYLSNRQQHLLTYKAYAAYVLAKIKQVNLQDIRQAYDSNAKSSKTALPFAHYAMALELMGDERRANQAWLQAIDFSDYNKNYYYYGDYGTNVRDLSQVILLGGQSHLVKKLSKTTAALFPKLLQEIKNKPRMSTQESGALFKLAKSIEYNKKLGKWSMVVNRNNHSDDYSQSTDLIKTWYENDAKHSVSITNTSQIPLFVDFNAQGYRKSIKPENNGIKIQRKYYDTKGNAIDIKQLKTGSMVLVHLEVKLDKSHKYLPDAILVELLPAGLELENQNLEHSFKIEELKIAKKHLSQWQASTRITHQEFRDDRFVAAVALSHYRPSHIFYLARAVTPGTYNIPSTIVEDMYHPEIRAIGKGDGKMQIVE